MTGWQITQAGHATDWEAAATLIGEYLDWLALDVTFQGTQGELADLPAMYGPPSGAALLARSPADGAVAGMVGVRRFAGADAEMKRMYVRPPFRGTGAGRALAEAAVDEARRLGYRRILLDTIETMEAAVSLYRSLGFVDTEPYRHNPFPGATFLGLEL